MSKIEIDEVDWCQEQHALKHYAAIMKAARWMNACYESYHVYTSKHEERKERFYKREIDLMRRAEGFFNLLIEAPDIEIRLGASITDALITEYKQIIAELLA